MTIASASKRVTKCVSNFTRNISAVAYVEFAYAFPIMMAVGLGGIEATNLALANMRTSQVALSMADNSSRVGQDSVLSLTQFREADVADSFAAAQKQAGRFDITTRGRIILSSLQKNNDGGQWIAWQRCAGLLKDKGALVKSSYGVEGTGKTGTNFKGMGPASNLIVAPDDNAVMFVEIFYDYEPLISAALFGTPRLHYTAAFIVRDERDLTQIVPSAGVTKATC